jgi:serpin B
LTLPRFRFETSVALGHVLTEMGMDKAFDSTQADFSDMTPDRFWLSEVLHKTYVDVNEEGTEAAGATAAILTTGCGADNEPLVMKIDRPFLTVCGHSESDLTGILLFVGRLVDPS